MAIGTTDRWASPLGTVPDRARFVEGAAILGSAALGLRLLASLLDIHADGL